MKVPSTFLVRTIVLLVASSTFSHAGLVPIKRYSNDTASVVDLAGLHSDATTRDHFVALFETPSQCPKPGDRPVWCSSAAKTCCFDPNANPPVLNACLWDLLGTDGVNVKNYISKKNIKVDKTNTWLNGLLYDSGTPNQACTISTPCTVVPCPPDGKATTEEMMRYVAIMAGLRYLTYQSTYFVTIRNLFDSTTANTVMDVYNNIFVVKASVKAEPLNKNIAPAVGLFMSLGAAATSVMTGGALTQAFKYFKILVDLAKSTSEVINTLTAEGAKAIASNSAAAFKESWTTSQSVFLNQLNKNVDQAMTDPTVAFKQMSATDKTFWLSLGTIPLWTHPQDFKDAATTMLRKYVVSQALSAQGIFLHVERHCSGLEKNYPAGACLTPPGQSEQVTVFPVDWTPTIVSDGNQDGYNVRRFAGGDNVAKYVSWDTILKSAWQCQDAGSGYLINRNGAVNFDTISTLLDPKKADAGLSTFSELTVPCWYSIPVCWHKSDMLAKYCKAFMQSNDGSKRYKCYFAGPYGSSWDRTEQCLSVAPEKGLENDKKQYFAGQFGGGEDLICALTYNKQSLGPGDLFRGYTRNGPHFKGAPSGPYPLPRDCPEWGSPYN